MKIAVWIASWLLAAAFVIVGAGKLFASTSDLHTTAHDVPVALLRIAGAAELLGAVGLVLPAATRIMPVLTPVAASGLVLTMTGATITNITIDEPATATVTLILGLLAALVAWARFGPFAVEPRGIGAEQPTAMATSR